MSYVIVADDAFPLSTNCMKPYPQNNLIISKRLFHNRLSRARRTVETEFGILVSRFRIFHTKIFVQLANATKIVLCCCVLHNMLRTLWNISYSAIGYNDVVGDNGNINKGSWRSEPQSPYVQPIQSTQARYSSHNAEEVSSHFKDYFETRGQVSWQWDKI